MGSESYRQSSTSFSGGGGGSWVPPPPHMVAAHAVHKRERKACRGPKTAPGALRK